MALPESADRFNEASRRHYSSAEHDELRLVALEAAIEGAPEAKALAKTYAELCVATFVPPVPLLWPRRTAGDRLRVVVLLPVSASDFASRVLAALAALPPSNFESMLASLGPPAPDVVVALGDAATRIAVVGMHPDFAVAKAIAVRDPDVLVDMVGLAGAVGQLLAYRPARAIWTVAAWALSAPLADRVIATADEFAAALSTVFDARDATEECPVSTPALAAMWEEGVRAHQRADGSRARDVYARVLALQPGFAPAHFLSGVLARDSGDASTAAREFTAAVDAAPDYVDARLASVRMATERGDDTGAVALCEQGLARMPASVALWRALGHAHLARRDGAAAALAFERALAATPADADTHYNHGVALQMRRALPEAARAYRQALTLAPDLVAAAFNLGVVHQEERAHDAAIAAYEAVLRSDPKHAAAYKNLGEVLFAAGRFDAWFANFRRFEANCPDALSLAVQALEVLQYQGEFAQIDRYLARLGRGEFRAGNESDFVDSVEQLLYLLLFFDVGPELLFKWSQAYDAVAKRVYGKPLPSPSTRKPGRLRVGYLSADLRNHVMGKMIWHAVQHHDRSRFDVAFYSLSHDSDEWTDRFRGVADRFVDVADLSEHAAAQRIAEDDLDILVDLSTHTKGAKPGILALKPARLQITHVASAGTVGLSTVDFKLTDRKADLAETQAFQLETLLPMEGCVYPFRHVAPAAKHPFRRDRIDVPTEAVVIGAFVTALKLSRRCLGLWREVLRRVPVAKIAFSPAFPAARESYLRVAAAAGIGADRIVFVPQGRDDAENQARYELVDFVLDTMPFGGVNGTLEALDMGVPVVTLVGRRHGERTGYDMLANLGITDTTATNSSEYIEIAVRLATDPTFMANVRRAIRAGLPRSPLTDMVAHTRALERAYLAALAAKVPDALSAASECQR